MAEETTRFEIGRVITRAFSVTGASPMVLLALSALWSVPGLAYEHYRPFISAPGAAASNPYRAALAALALGLLINTLSSTLSGASLVKATFQVLDNRKASFAECLLVAVKDIGPLLAIVVLGSLGVLLGLFLFVVPGVILTLMWFVVVAVRVMERTSVGDAFRRSSALTRGYRWRIAGAALVFFIPAFLLGSMVGPLTRLFASDGYSASYAVAYMSLHAVAAIATVMFGGIFNASIYYELRLAKEGAMPQQLAAVFS